MSRPSSRSQHVALVGATGEAGAFILCELLLRGHRVTAVVRNPAKVPVHAQVTAVQADAGDADALAAAIKGHDAVISSIRYIDSDPATLIAAAKASGVPRYLVVGGAGSLTLPGSPVLVKDEVPYPDFVMAEADRGLLFLQLLRQETMLDWTFLSPSKYFKNTGRTGMFRLGKDELLVDAAGDSKISFQDFAVAMVDELEQPRHSRQRFTVGY